MTLGSRTKAIPSSQLLLRPWIGNAPIVLRLSGLLRFLDSSTEGGPNSRPWCVSAARPPCSHWQRGLPPFPFVESGFDERSRQCFTHDNMSIADQGFPFSGVALLSCLPP